MCKRKRPATEAGGAAAARPLEKAAGGGGGRTGLLGGPGARSLFFHSFCPFGRAVRSPPPPQTVHRNRNSGAQLWLKRKSPFQLQVRVGQQLRV